MHAYHEALQVYVVCTVCAAYVVASAVLLCDGIHYVLGVYTYQYVDMRITCTVHCMRSSVQCVAQLLCYAYILRIHVCTAVRPL